MPWRSKGTQIWQWLADEMKAEGGEKVTSVFTAYAVGNNEAPPAKCAFKP